MRFDLVDLRLFDAVARTGSISAGAKAAHLALASASARISGMEAALGVELLRRGRRGVTPTAAGRSLLQHARAITSQVERMRGDLRTFSKGMKGEIRLLSNTAGLVEIVPAALQRFLAANPYVEVDLEERPSAEIVAAVADGRAEFGIIADSCDWDGLEVRRLGLDQLMVIVGPGHALASRPEVSFSELLDEPFIGLGDGALHDHLAAQAASLRRRINYRVRLRSFEAIARLVEAGVGVSVLPIAALNRTPALMVTAIPLTDAWADRRLLVCARSFAALSAHAYRLIDDLRETDIGS